eukprot:gene2497-2843_t
MPLDNDQLQQITTNCPDLNVLSINSLLVSDKGIERGLVPLGNLQHLSLVSSGHGPTQEYIKQSGKSLSPTITPLSLYTISSQLPDLRSLKFSLFPQQLNHKSLFENGIVEPSQHNDHTQSDLDRAVSSLTSCKQLENLELNSCNITECTIIRLLGQFNMLRHLGISRNYALTSLCIKSNSLTHLDLSCLSMLKCIQIDSFSLQELSIEGCESLQSTELSTPALRVLSMEGCTGTLALVSAVNLRSLSLFECSDLTEQDFLEMLESLISLEELFIYLQQVVHLRICSGSLRRLDIEAWSGIRSCIMDCPNLLEIKANESSLEYFYLKADHPQSIELDFCDQLRNIIIDVISSHHFTFSQTHPSPSTHLGIDLSSFTSRQEGDDDNGQQFLSPTTLFFQAHQFIRNCIILSGNLLGKLVTQEIGALSIEQLSFSTYIIEVGKIFKINTYHESR